VNGDRYQCKIWGIVGELERALDVSKFQERRGRCIAFTAV